VRSEASLAAKAKPDLEKEASAAADTLSDPEKRILYDDGHDLQVHVLEDGSLAPSISDRVLRTFFPQLFEYEPYGPPSETDETRPQADVPAQKPLLP
jgi:DnaJ-class molecular chaperone